MTPEAMRRVREAIERSLELPEGSRDESISEALAGEPDLVRLAHRLLAGESELNGFLEVERTPHMTDTLAHAAIGAPIGRQIGAYRITGVLAVGGMGTVFSAERTDEQFEQRVAIKLVNMGMDTPEMLARFEQERQMLADLEHPGIARLLDGGTTEDGRPFIVMELIYGRPIDAYCRGARLPVRDRVELVRRVCDAIHFAHQRLVVHRDIKPSNILVTETGHPKIVDFGISKLLEEREDRADATTMTVTALRALTPQYASPEQIQGRRVTTASDVYSLGVVLYELLTGRRPYAVENLPRYEQERMICETEPARPSTAVSRDASAEPGPERALQARDLRGDLDTIVMCAMSKDPGRRYASAEQLGADLDRYLKGLPLTARPDTFRYRASKFVRRNRLGVAAVAAVVIAVLVGLGAVSISLLRVQRAEQQAQQERLAAERSSEHAVEVAAFLRDVLSFANPYDTGRVPTLLDLLVDAEERIESELNERPLVEADVRYALAQAYSGLWQWSEVAHHAAIAVAHSDKYRGPDDPTTIAQRQLLGMALAHMANPRAVVEQEDAYRRIRARCADPSEELAYATGLLAFAKWGGRGDSMEPDAEEFFNRSLEMYDRTGAGDSHQRATIMHLYAAFLHTHLRIDEATGMYERAIGMYARSPGSGGRFPAEAQNAYATLLRLAGRVDDAVEHMRAYVEMSPEVINDHRIIGGRWQLAWFLLLRGDLEQADVAYHDAIRRQLEYVRDHNKRQTPNARRALRLVPESAYDTPELPDYMAFYRLAASVDSSQAPIAQYTAVAAMMAERGLYGTAGQILRQLREDCIARFGAGFWRVPHIEGLLGDCYRRAGRYEAAEPLLLKSFAGLQVPFGADDPTVDRARHRLHLLYTEWGREEEARRYEPQGPEQTRITL